MQFPVTSAVRHKLAPAVPTAIPQQNTVQDVAIMYLLMKQMGFASNELNATVTSMLMSQMGMMPTTPMAPVAKLAKKEPTAVLPQTGRSIDKKSAPATITVPVNSLKKDKNPVPADEKKKPYASILGTKSNSSDDDNGFVEPKRRLSNKERSEQKTPSKPAVKSSVKPVLARGDRCSNYGQFGKCLDCSEAHCEVFMHDKGHLKQEKCTSCKFHGEACGCKYRHLKMHAWTAMEKAKATRPMCPIIEVGEICAHLAEKLANKSKKGIDFKALSDETRSHCGRFIHNVDLESVNYRYCNYDENCTNDHCDFVHTEDMWTEEQWFVEEQKTEKENTPAPEEPDSPKKATKALRAEEKEVLDMRKVEAEEEAKRKANEKAKKKKSKKAPEPVKPDSDSDETAEPEPDSRTGLSGSEARDADSSESDVKPAPKAKAKTAKKAKKRADDSDDEDKVPPVDSSDNDE